MIIIKNQQIDSGGGNALQHAIVMWHGNKASLADTGWEIYAPAEYVFVMGSNNEGDIITTPIGSNEHTHTVPNTNTTGGHAGSGHGVASSNVGGGNGSVTVSFPNTPPGVGEPHANPSHVHTSHTVTSSSTTGDHAHTNPSSKSSSHIPLNKGLYWIEAVEEVEELLNTILPWSHASGDIPTGWYLCDGANETIDLTGYFVYSIKEDVELGVETGNATHFHIMNSANSSGAHGHNVSGTVGSNGISMTAGITQSGSILVIRSHTHTFSGSTPTGNSAHTHDVYDSLTANNLPPYVFLYFIQKKG